MHVVLYARVSTTRQAENDLSIPDQLRQMREWCKSNECMVLHEYIEPGASATDDKRPVFQEMIERALQKPNQFDAIIIHSLSRFFRDGIDFGLYERKLAKNKVKVISITQQTTDDDSGMMMRRMINLFDEHQSRENSKHTSRAMRENARQGFFNGSRAPFGYMAVTTDVNGSRGRKKKKLAINEAEAGIVRMIYSLYLNGMNGKRFGCKDIGKYLTEKGYLMRGAAWNIHKVHQVLADSLYMGDYCFNVIDSKNKIKRPPEEWIITKIPPIVDALQYESVRILREQRSPDKTPPRRVNSPTLLTGLLKCEHCGGSYTLVTGKSGKYKYYKCTTRQSKGNHACPSSNIPMEKLDSLILEQLAEKVLEPKRLQVLIAEMRKKIGNEQDIKQSRVNQINKEIKLIEQKQMRLLEAIENGVPFDELVQKRTQQNKAAREALLIELAGVSRQKSIPIDHLRASQVELISKSIKNKLLKTDTTFAKSYLNLLVSEIAIRDKQATIKGSYSGFVAITKADKTKAGHSLQVPAFISDWRARSDSNARPFGS